MRKAGTVWVWEKCHAPMCAFAFEGGLGGETMKLRPLVYAVVIVGLVVATSVPASAAWYDGGILGMQQKFCDWLAELVVCDGWSGC